ncbi:DUF485 domain-containing protein [Kitasatospora sp. NPDC058190]|uniref:DUF485 domain-containing protein n=1 Tax=Kitasatospora sp. NPDC058190 TaxID=3346371 RepID=UPI0036D765FD
MIDPAASSRGDPPWIGGDPRSTELRSTYRRFVFPVTEAFLLWFLANVLCSARARGFVAAKVVGSVNVAGLRTATVRLDLRHSPGPSPAPAGRGGDQELTENQA